MRILLFVLLAFAQLAFAQVPAEQLPSLQKRIVEFWDNGGDDIEHELIPRTDYKNEADQFLRMLEQQEKTNKLLAIARYRTELKDEQGSTKLIFIEYSDINGGGVEVFDENGFRVLNGQFIKDAFLAWNLVGEP